MTISRLPLQRKEAPIILGAGSLLDILGTGCARQILASLDRHFLVDSRVGNRLPNGDVGKAGLAALLTEGIVRSEPLPAGAIAIFISLAGGAPPNDLSDEEACCVALAWSAQGIAVLGDGKASRVGEFVIPGRVLHSLDLLSAPAVHEVVGPVFLAGLLARARVSSRMRMPSRFQDWASALNKSICNGSDSIDVNNVGQAASPAP